MSETKKRKVHTAQFKAKVGLEVLCGGKTINQIGQDLAAAPFLTQHPDASCLGFARLVMFFTLSASNTNNL